MLEGGYVRTYGFTELLDWRGQGARLCFEGSMDQSVNCLIDRSTSIPGSRTILAKAKQPNLSMKISSTATGVDGTGPCTSIQLLPWKRSSTRCKPCSSNEMEMQAAICRILISLQGRVCNRGPAFADGTHAVNWGTSFS